MCWNSSTFSSENMADTSSPVGDGSESCSSGDHIQEPKSEDVTEDMRKDADSFKDKANDFFKSKNMYLTATLSCSTFTLTF